MKKKMLALLSLPIIAMALGGCGNKNNSGSGDNTGTTTPVAKRYTVAFDVDGVRYKTLKVKEGEKITETVVNPTKEGWKFDCWMEGTTKIDLAEYVVTHDVTFTAKFVEAGDVLSVDDVKEDGKTYHIVLGWWEVKDENDPTKRTSYLTKDSVRLFYGNFINYLKATGSTEAQIANISFRNYSSDTVANMGVAINADADVDLMIGVGANIFTTAACTPFNTSDDSKFQTEMGLKDDGTYTSRYVALMGGANEVAQAAFTWLQTDAGKKSFKAELTADEIANSLLPEEINLTVTVHGDSDLVTTLTDKDSAISMPAFTIPDGKQWSGFATSVDGEVALKKASDAVLKYDDVKGLVAEGANTLDLYPVYEDAPVATKDLTVYVQTHATRLPEYEAKLMEARFEAATGKDIELICNSGDAAGFTAAVDADLTADVVVGGNSPVASMNLKADTTVGTVGAKHCVNTSRKVGIMATVAADQLATAQEFYNFMVAEAVALEVHSTFWRVGTWVTADEVTAIKATALDAAKAALAVTGDDTLESKYNVSLTYTEIDPSVTKVDALGTATKALRDGKGTDLIYGCGANVTTTGGFADATVRDIPATTVAAGRKLAVVNSNVVTLAIADAIAPETVA